MKNNDHAWRTLLPEADSEEGGGLAVDDNDQANDEVVPEPVLRPAPELKVC